MATTTFHPFGRLSRELQEIIWQHASGGDGYDRNGPGRTIEVLLLPSNAHWLKPDQFKQCKPNLGPLRFDFRLVEGSRADEDLKFPKRAHPLSQANSHSRGVFRRFNPDALRIIDLDNPKRSGPLIRFNASRDKIFMDLETLYYLKEYASYLDTKMLTLPRMLCGFDRIQTLSRPLGSTLEVAHAMLRLLEGGPTQAEYTIIPSIQGLHIDDSVVGSVMDSTTLSRRLYRTLNGMWHWSLSREQRACIKRGLDRVQNLGQQPSHRSGNVIGLIQRLPVERGSDGGTDEHE